MCRGDKKSGTRTDIDETPGALSDLVRSPLNGGWLTGEYRPGNPPPVGSRAERHSDHVDYRATDARS